jgi:26S proteasome regulatory subunit T3|mmetsp:Transcript_87182/g.141293  ORF Transcript_87182/g.141293 Transcript_87182/m.141293 type:complete len:391 (-) Transcript_87182:710-1882(-)
MNVILSKIYQKNLTSIIKLKSSKNVVEILRIFFEEEIESLKKQLVIFQNEISRFQSVPLIIGQLVEKLDKNFCIIGSTTGNNYLVRIISTIDYDKLKLNSPVALHRNSNALVNFLDDEGDSGINIILPIEKPKVNYTEIGGLEKQKEEIRETIELPLINQKLYEEIGIDPPNGVLLYGPPGTGKTMLVKAIAAKTAAAFIKAVGSEFVQKYLGDGPKLVRDLFKTAKKYAPSIIFIDEIDAIATRRFDAQTGADREVQRILIEFLSQMDGFEKNLNVKIIMCTNRIDTLDPAILRPGRIDRKIEFPLPTIQEKRFMFQTLTSSMNLSREVDMEYFISKKEKLSGAVIAAICQEAGIQAIRKNRYIITQDDFLISYKLNVGFPIQIPDFYI